jgi:hypothetical protein
MNFEYKITPSDYAEAQSLYFKSGDSPKRIKNAVGWILIGLYFIFICCHQRPVGLAQILILVPGVMWIYSGIINLFLPKWYFRRQYPKSGLSGKTFKASVNENTLEVEGDTCYWRIKWEGVTVKEENLHIFILFSHPIIFMFGKQYLTNEQQEQLRRLMDLQH